MIGLESVMIGLLLVCHVVILLNEFCLISQLNRFQAVFILAGIFSLIAALVIVAAPNLIFPARSRKPEVPKNHGPLSVKS